jgi:multidrug efflux pump subunit AcrA (membrane-fusion protein)
MSIRPRKLWSKTTLFYTVLVAAVCAATAFGLDSVFAGPSSATAGATRTATVQRGTVQASVTASGNISSAATTSLNFATSGTLTAVGVAVGDTVSVGEVLAKIDPSSAQTALTAAQDQLSSARYNLKVAEAGPTATQNALNNANVAQANLTVTADEQQLTDDKSALATARTQLKTDEAASCPTVTATPSSSSSGSSTSASSASGDSSKGSTGSTTTTTTPATSSSTTTSISSCTQDNNTITSDKQTDQRAQLTVEQAQASLASTKATIAANSTPSPATIAQDQGQVAQDTQTVSDDEKALSETTLTSPVAGTVTALSDSVGESVSGTSSASSATGGSSSPSAATGGGAGGAGGTSSSATTASSSSSSAFITITNLGQLEVVAGFAEADVTNIKVGQPATATLAALPNTELSGTVTAVSPTSTVSSNVVTYETTLSLNDPPSDVKIGMTANVSVITDSKSDVLELPSAAITTTGTTSTVSTIDNGTKSTHPVVVGLVGSSTTQILSGVNIGEVVVEPTVSVTSGATTTAGAGTAGVGGGGLGGGGFGGGVRG